MANTDAWLRRLKPLLFLALAAPLALVGVDVWRELVQPGSALGADPGEALVHRLGSWALRMLLLTLAVSSASRLLRRPWLIRVRRMVGLWAFAYVCLHFAAYLGLLAGLEWNTVVADIARRPYITVGFLALALLIPLAITSTRGWQRRLGRRWRQLHRLVYPAAVAAWVHLLWLSKASTMEPFIYGAVLLALFGERLATTIRRSKRTRRPMDNHAYWRANLRLVAVCLAVWFTVSFGFGVLLADVLNQVPLGGFQLGFWFAQQGSIYVFLALIAVYAVGMAKIDRKHGVEEEP